jgi:hypothetical protein
MREMFDPAFDCLPLELLGEVTTDLLVAYATLSLVG